MLNLVTLSVLLLFVLTVAGCSGSAATPSPDATPVLTTRLLESNFWHARLQTNHHVTARHALAQCESTGRINNFRIAAGDAEGTYRGLRFDDSDFYKVIEGVSRILMDSPDPALEAELDRLIDIVARAQQPDGYLYTVMQVPHPEHAPVKGVVPGERWVHEQESHETYCMGHLIEAGIAHHQATGKRSLLNVAIKAADCLDDNFGPGKLELPSGHQQVEIALARLSKVTGDERYLKLAEFFLEQRGRLSPDRKRHWGAYFQDHLPIRQQTEAVGHAVRAAYLYMAMADVASATGNDEYRKVLHTLWGNVAEKKLYLTGGIGGGAGEGFSAEYQLPNLRAYNETCSSVANILWQQRMFVFDTDSKYIDIAERCLYNSFLSGVSLEGDAFFYPNKLTSVNGHQRSPWFRCACCPPNVLRFLPQVPSLFYSTRQNTLLVNMFGSSETRVTLPAGEVRLVQTSRYPWDGKVALEVHPRKPSSFTLAIRHPGWINKPFPSDLYRYADQLPEHETSFQITVNGKPHRGAVSGGYEHITRRWRPGDRVEFEFPMPIRRVVASDKVSACRGRVALMRGPLVYAAEGHDNDGMVHSLLVQNGSRFTPTMRDDLLGGLVTITGNVQNLATGPDGNAIAKSHRMTAIPYYAWAHRGRSPMRVWLAADSRSAWPIPTDLAYSRAKITTSGANRWTPTGAVNDQHLPLSSDDTETPRFLWDNTSSAPVGAGELEGTPTSSSFKDGVRWIQYDFVEPITLSSTAIYWATDAHGRCAIPTDYRVLYLDHGVWKRIKAKLPAPQPDQLQSIAFEPVTTTAVRLEVVTRKQKSAGIMEWAVR